MFGTRFIVLVWFEVSFHARLAVIPISTFTDTEVEGGQSVEVTAGNSSWSIDDKYFLAILMKMGPEPPQMQAT